MLRPVVDAGEVTAYAAMILFHCHYSATSIFSMQSPQMILTSFVALILCLQQGHTYFRVLLRFGGSVLPPVCVPPFPVFPPALGGGVQPPPLFIWISAHPCVMM